MSDNPDSFDRIEKVFNSPLSDRLELLSAFSDAEFCAFIFVLIGRMQDGSKLLSNDVVRDILIARTRKYGLIHSSFHPNLAKLLGAYANGKELVNIAFEIADSSLADYDAWIGSFNWELIIEKSEGRNYIFDIFHGDILGSTKLPREQIQNAMRYWNVTPCNDLSCNFCNVLQM
jgi:hypothetical protein